MNSQNDAENFYREGMRYNLSGDDSYQPSLARSFFERAAALGHIHAMRSLGLMLHQGSGGLKDLMQAIRCLAEAGLQKGDLESLECLLELLETEIDQGNDSINHVSLHKVAEELEQLLPLQKNVRSRISSIVHS
jgi:TPR repeat protein